MRGTEEKIFESRAFEVAPQNTGLHYLNEIFRGRQSIDGKPTDEMVAWGGEAVLDTFRIG